MLASHKLKELNGATTAGCDEAKRLNRAGSLERGGAVLDRRTSKPTSNQALTRPMNGLWAGARRKNGRAAHSGLTAWAWAIRGLDLIVTSDRKPNLETRGMPQPRDRDEEQCEDEPAPPFGAVLQRCSCRTVHME